MIKSPLDLISECLIEREIPCSKIISEYRKQLEIDVSDAFIDLDKIFLVSCSKTSYKFYYPFHISGKGLFYEQLQNYSWYYLPWKWEHQVVYKSLKKDSKILEVGCGSADFVRKCHNEKYDITGLELNSLAVSQAQSAGLKVFNESIQDFASKNYEEYDLVCSFQVLEHISEVNSFIKSCIHCLKKGGRLIICVPNNDSFIKNDEFNVLNLPPHHMGLWNKKSLISLTEIFPLKIKTIIEEPLQEYHYNWYLYLKEVMISKNRLVAFLYFKLRINKISYQFIKLISPFLKGHSILANYVKV